MDRIECEAAALVRALKGLSAIAKGDMAVLTNVLIEYDNGTVVFTTTNATQQISRRASMETKGSGAVAVDASRLTALASAAPAGANAVIEISDTQIVLKYGRSRYAFQTADAATFPKLAPPPADATAVEVGEEFIRALRGTQHAICKNDVHWDKTCIALHVRNGILEASATDTSRLALRTIGELDVPDSLLPTDAIDLILSNDGDSAIEMVFTPTMAWIDLGDVLIGSKLIDAKPQPYERLLGVNPAITLDIDRKSMVDALTRLLIVADDKDKSVIVETSADHVVITNNSGREEIPCSCDGELRIGFRAAHLRESLKSLEAESVTFHLTTPMGPVKVFSDAQPGATLVVMPYRVKPVEYTNVAEREMTHA